jgi:hypothetical protein
MSTGLWTSSNSTFLNGPVGNHNSGANLRYLHGFSAYSKIRYNSIMNTLIGSHQLTKGLTYRLEGPEPIDNIVYYSGVHDPSRKYRALNLAIFLPDPSNLSTRRIVSLNNYTIYEKKELLCI